jgi:hypothetical protein
MKATQIFGTSGSSDLHYADLLPLLQPPTANDRQHAQSQVDAACSAVVSMLRKAAADTLGHRTVVPGVTNP